MQRTEKGWKLHFDDGNSTEFSSYKDATQARWNSYEARVLNLNGAVREAIENSERNLINNQARRFEFDADTMSVSRMKRENPQLTATLDERMEISSFMDDGRAEQQQYAEAVAGNTALSQDRETMEASTLVLGTSSVSFREGVRVGVSKLYRGFNAASVVEETLETDASHLLKNGKREWMIKALRETEQQTGEQLLPKGVADANLTVLQLKEAYSHVGVSLFAGEAVKGRNGKANPRLSNNRKWLLGVQRSALGRAMNASAQKFAAMFRRAQRLEQARVGVGVHEQGDAKPGDGGNNNNSSTLQAELEETLNRSLGLSEGAVMDATENGSIDSTTDVNAEADVSFAIQSGNEGAGKSDPASKSKAVDSKTNEWYGYTDEQRQRFQEAIRETEGIYNQATFGDSRGNRSVPETDRERVLRSYRSVAVGEIVLVDQGIKPLFHEAWIFTPQEAAVLVNSIRQKFPHLEAEAWGPHVVIWHPDAIKAVLTTDPAHYGSDAREAVRKAAESDEIGELLGNHARTRMAGDTVVQYYVNGEPIAGGFITQRAVSEKLAEQRRQVFEMTFGESVSVELASKGKPTGESTHSTVEKVDGDISGTNTSSQTSSTSQIEQSQDHARDQFKENGDISFSLGPDVVRRWVERQKPIAAPKVKLPYVGEMQLRKFAQGMWKQLPDSTKARDGRTVIIKHNAQGTEDVLFEHLITSHNKDGSRTWTDRGRITSLSRIPSTVENARPRFIAKNGNHIYIQKFDDQTHHYVVTTPDGVLTSHGRTDALTSQWLRRAEDDFFLSAERLELFSPPSAQSEQGRSSGAALTSPSQSNDAPGMPSLTTRPVDENTSTQSNSQEGNLSNTNAHRMPDANLNQDSDVSFSLKGFAGTRMPNEPKRLAIQQKLAELIDFNQIKLIDSDARIGYRGSLARGSKNSTTRDGGPFDPDDFDIDLFIVSAKIASIWKRGKLRERWGTKIDVIRQAQRELEKQLRQLPEFKGLREANGNDFRFRIFTKKEITKKAQDGDAQVFFRKPD